jgi:UDP-N-acetylmuramoylalanine--D-glutamate ligase
LITLFGYGNTTKEIAKKYKGQCEIFDDNIKNISSDEFGNQLFPSSLFDPQNSNIQIVSPGIAPNHPLPMTSNNLISDYDFFYKEFPFSIWISGTNGKTTTTQILEHLLKSKNAISGGNIGNAIASLNRSSPIWILETSSFTLHYTKIAKPNIYVLLPIKPDHISWHGSFEEYERAKLKPLDNMQEGEMAIVPSKYKDYPTNAFLVSYETSDDLCSFFDIDKSKVNFKEPFLLDAILGLCVTKALFEEIDYELVNSFKTDAHKLEEIYDKNNNLWVNDSKATNIDATKEALKRYKDKKILLILGGDEKGVDLEELFIFIKNQNLDIMLFLIGAKICHLVKLAIKHDINYVESIHISNATNEIKKIIDKNSIALLSPACASLDQFTSYSHRGNEFKKNIEL